MSALGGELFDANHLRGGAIADQGEGDEAAAIVAVEVFALAQDLAVVDGLLVDALGRGVGERGTDSVFDVNIVDERDKHLVTDLEDGSGSVGGLVDGDEILADTVAVIETNHQGAAIVVDGADHGAVRLAESRAEVVIAANQRTEALFCLDVGEVCGGSDGSGGDGADLHGHSVVLRASKLYGSRLISLFASGNRKFHRQSNRSTILETKSQERFKDSEMDCCFGCFLPEDWEKEKILLE